jgi:anti-sigma factor RsiW
VSQLQAGHLGDLGTALVDDQLSPEARDMALAHLAGCPDCRQDVEQQRRLKARLRELTEPDLPMTLALRLSALKPAAAPSAAHNSPPGDGFAALAFPIRDRSRVFSPRRGRLLAGAASVLLFGVGTAFAAAADVQASSPAGTAGNSLSTGQTQVTAVTAVTRSVPANDPAFDAMNASFVP